jgi:hypothetical protein
MLACVSLRQPASACACLRLPAPDHGNFSRTPQIPNAERKKIISLFMALLAHLPKNY